MKYRRLTSNGDYSFGQGSQSFLLDISAVAQAVKTRLSLLKGEWWENINDGLPLFQSIQKYASRGSVDLLIKNIILGTRNVTGVSGVKGTYDPQKRRYSYTAEVSTVYGTITVSQEV